jgi:hypothetical protein
VADGFVSRWARRKEQVRRGETPAEPVTELPAPSAPVLAPAPLPQPVTAQDVQDKPPAPTLADVALLTRESDYTRFVAPGVGEDVKRAAMKKLFADPHFNVMDGLDTYIEDFGKPDPLPASWLRQMVQSKALGLFDDEDDETARAAAEAAPETPQPLTSPDGAAPVELAPSDPVVPHVAAEPAPEDEDPDLRLQPHDAARRPGAGEGPGGQPGGVD